MFCAPSYTTRTESYQKSNKYSPVFVMDTGTKNAILMIRMISNTARQIENGVPFCFDDTKALLTSEGVKNVFLNFALIVIKCESRRSNKLI